MNEATRGFVEWLQLVQTGLAYMGLTIPLLSVQIFGALLVLAAIWMLWRAQHSKDNPFDAGAMFQDDRNRTSSMKFLAVIGGLASVWCVVYLTVSGKLDTLLFVGWLSAILLGKVGTDWVDASKRGTEPPGPPKPKGDDQ